MTFKVEFHLNVADETNEARLWYESQRTGLGAEFVAEVNHTIRDVADSPLLGSPAKQLPDFSDVIRTFDPGWGRSD